MAGTILIIDDISANRLILGVKLSAARYSAVHAASGAEGLALARKIRPDLILVDHFLPDVDGVSVCRTLRADPVTADVPIIVVSAAPSDERRIAALQAGADDVMAKPVDDLVLLARIRSLVRSNETTAGLSAQAVEVLGLAEGPAAFRHAPRIVLSGQDGPQLAGMQAAIAELMRAEPFVVATERLLDLADREPPPDLIVLTDPPGQHDETLMTLSELRARPATRNTVVCLRADTSDRGSVAMAYDLGAHDVFPLSASRQEVTLRIESLLQRKRRSDSLRAGVEAGLRLSVTDPLTGLHNRRFTLPQLERMVQAGSVSGRTVAVMLLDIDRFKQVNDRYGHPSGDAVLAEVAQRFRQNLRSVDLVGRIGGEEFLVALPDCCPADAGATAERLRRVVSDMPIALPEGGTVTVTLSVGLAISRAAHDDANTLIARADRALLVAKAEGRNQVTIARDAA